MIPDISFRTKDSPRFVGDTLCFYQGDTFTVQFIFELFRGNEEITLQPDDVISFEFHRPNMLPAFVEKAFTGITGNIVEFDWNDEWTKNFRRGYYEYRIRYRSGGGKMTTVAAYGRISVE